ncbi:hypothetical protein HOD75_01125 [archaeon]|jgi:predicted aspartyl protease|nr:hypothetical protein [archaeon]MBT4241480.1 hypothetical protein [archaeon]MBT4417649.1 hypothetical protein [archaeon]
MSFSFKYKPVLLKSGRKTHRPLIPFTLIGNNKEYGFFGILDSGSDLTVLPKEVADFLGVKKIGEDELTGISNDKVKVDLGYINIIFGKNREEREYTLPILINEKSDNIIIGRAGFFEQFKITFCEAEKRMTFKKMFEKQKYK